MIVMNEVEYFSARALHYRQKSQAAADIGLRQAFEAIARDFSARAAAGDRSGELYVIEGVAPDP